MFRDVRSRVERWPLATPFRISRGVKTVAEVVTVAIRQGDHCGAGEGVPYARYGETVDSVVQQVRRVEHALVDGATRADVAKLLPAGAARNAVDCALWQLERQLSGQTLAEKIGGRPVSALTTALTVGLDQPGRMGDAAAALRGAGLIKVKVDGDDPEACLRAVREAVPDAALIVDPNESWTMEILEQMQSCLRDLQVAFVEQPLAAEDDHWLEDFEPLVPICADESCHIAADLDRLARRYDMVNIKLDKTGGLTEALHLLDVARAQGFGIMVGCMICTSLSIAPAFHVAANADYADLDGPLWLKQDRAGGVRLENGQLLPADERLIGTEWAMDAQNVDPRQDEHSG